MKVRNILVFPAGSEIGLEINEALRQCKEVKLFGAGASAPSHAPFTFENFYILPTINEPNWLDELCALCRSLEIDYIFPAYDDIVVALASEQHQIPAVILTASLDTCLITRSKRATYRRLQTVLRVPKIIDLPPRLDDYPLIVKPNCGQGSQGVTLAHTHEELTVAIAALDDPLVCEYLPGEEYTVDCFSDREQGLVFAGARVRRRMRNGIAVNTSPVALEGVEKLARSIQDNLAMRGAWFFQIKRAADGELCLLEVAPRIAGSMSTHRVLGINFPLLTIFEQERAPIRLLFNHDAIELDRALRNRFRHSITFSTLYIDLDDTLILRDCVNLDAVKLIYKALNQGKIVKLITRHAGDLHSKIKHHHLEGIFNEIIHIQDKSPKSLYIKEPEAILVDDSFSERWEVQHTLNIRTFDCSMIELLSETI